MNLILTQQQRGVSNRPADSQAVNIFLFFQPCRQQLPLQPHLKAHPAPQHPVGEPAARPQRGEPSPEPRLATRTIRTSLKVQVTVICADSKERQGLKSANRSLKPCNRMRFVSRVLHGSSLTLSSSSSSASSVSAGGCGDLALMEKRIETDAAVFWIICVLSLLMFIFCLLDLFV